jgi:hypothetical protein
LKDDVLKKKVRAHRIQKMMLLRGSLLLVSVRYAFNATCIVS